MPNVRFVPILTLALGMLAGCAERSAEPAMTPAADRTTPAPATSDPPPALPSPSPATATTPPATTPAAADAAAQNRVQGRYSYLTDEMSLDMIGPRVCFHPDAASAKTLPQRDGATGRMVWFCFEDSEAVARTLGFELKPPADGCGLEGQASVTVTGYRFGAPNSDETDSARLVSVERAEPPKPVRCAQ
ncbi:MAG TPA: hypothetical protein VEY50_09625 [Lysobacter sp.]|nr:hypothetical protein [Lysobacter sp.]